MSSAKNFGKKNRMGRSEMLSYIKEGVLPPDEIRSPGQNEVEKV